MNLAKSILFCGALLALSALPPSRPAFPAFNPDSDVRNILADGSANADAWHFAAIR